MAKRYEWSTELDSEIVVSMIRYETAEELLSKMWNTPIEELSSCSMGGYDGDGKEYNFSFTEMIQNIKTMGCYAFANDKKEIHFWVDVAVCDPIDFVGMIGHEKGHLTKPFLDDEMEEEIKADGHGNSSAFAFRIYKDIYK